MPKTMNNYFIIREKMFHFDSLYFTCAACMCLQSEEMFASITAESMTCLSFVIGKTW